MIYQHNPYITRVRCLDYIDEICSYIFRLAVKISLSIKFSNWYFHVFKISCSH